MNKTDMTDRQDIVKMRINFGEKLKKLRISNNLTQRDLAPKLNVSRNHLSNIETGRIGFSVAFLFDTATFFNCSTDFLLGLNENLIDKNDEK